MIMNSIPYSTRNATNLFFHSYRCINLYKSRPDQSSITIQCVSVFCKLIAIVRDRESLLDYFIEWLVARWLVARCFFVASSLVASLSGGQMNGYHETKAGPVSVRDKYTVLHVHLPVFVKNCPLALKWLL